MINPVARSILWQHGQPAAVKDSEDAVDDIAKSVTGNMGCEMKDLKILTLDSNRAFMVITNAFKLWTINL